MSDETRTVHWRLPVRVASEGDSWEPFREKLAAWAESGEQLEVETPEETKNVCIRVPAAVLEKLEEEARRLTEETGRRWTAGRVAREIWDGWEAD